MLIICDHKDSCDIAKCHWKKPRDNSNNELHNAFCDHAKRTVSLINYERYLLKTLDKSNPNLIFKKRGQHNGF